VCLSTYPPRVCVCVLKRLSERYIHNSHLLRGTAIRETNGTSLSLFLFWYQLLSSSFLVSISVEKIHDSLREKETRMRYRKNPQILAPFYFFNQPEDFADFSVVTSQQGVVTKSFFFFLIYIF
jgi:hypothetical protein